MLIKDLNLYINEKNITTIMPYLSDYGDYGLEINGIKHKLGFNPDLMVTSCLSRKDFNSLQTAVYGKMKALHTQIIKKIEGK